MSTTPAIASLSSLPGFDPRTVPVVGVDDYNAFGHTIHQQVESARVKYGEYIFYSRQLDAHVDGIKFHRGCLLFW